MILTMILIITTIFSAQCALLFVIMYVTLYDENDNVPCKSAKEIMEKCSNYAVYSALAFVASLVLLILKLIF